MTHGQCDKVPHALTIETVTLGKNLDAEIVTIIRSSLGPVFGEPYSTEIDIITGLSESGCPLA